MSPLGRPEAPLTWTPARASRSPPIVVGGGSGCGRGQRDGGRGEAEGGTTGEPGGITHPGTVQRQSVTPHGGVTKEIHCASKEKPQRRQAGTRPAARGL